MGKGNGKLYIKINLINLAETINKDGYYTSGPQKSPVYYDGWDYTDVMDISDVDYIAINRTSIPQYSCKDKNLGNSGMLFNYNDEDFIIYSTNKATFLGISDKTGAMAGLKVYKIKEVMLPEFEIIVE